MWWWLGAAILAGIIEVLTLDFIFLMIGGGCLAAAVVQGLTGNAVAAVLMFCVATLVLLAVVRPPLRRYVKRSTPDKPMHTDALLGLEAYVLETVTDIQGQIRVDGDVWSARSQAAGVEFAEGTRVRVIRIDGATAVVAAEPDQHGQQPT